MSDNAKSQPHEPDSNEPNLGTTSLVGTQVMNVMFGFPLLVISTGFMFYAAIDQRHPLYLLMGVVMLVVVAIAAKFLFLVPIAQSVQHDDHHQFVDPDKSREN